MSGVATPDRPRLPLTALRVFESAARHESFLRAAEELAITPGAVSRQIKALEAELAVRLFERFNRAVRITDTGRRLATGIRQGLSLMEEAVNEVRNERPGVLAVTAMHSFAARWLVPRLHLFNERHPDIQVLVAASDTTVDLVRDRYDVAIRFGRGPFPGFSAHKLVSLFLFPVCSPRLLEETPLSTPHDLAKAHLLSTSIWPRASRTGATGSRWPARRRWSGGAASSSPTCTWLSRRPSPAAGWRWANAPW